MPSTSKCAKITPFIKATWLYLQHSPSSVATLSWGFTTDLVLKTFHKRQLKFREHHGVHMVGKSCSQRGLHKQIRVTRVTNTGIVQYGRKITPTTRAHSKRIRTRVHKMRCGFAFVQTVSIPLKWNASKSGAYIFHFALFAEESFSWYKVPNSTKIISMVVISVSVLVSQHFLLAKTFDQTATY